MNLFPVKRQNEVNIQKVAPKELLKAETVNSIIDALGKRRNLSQEMELLYDEPIWSFGIEWSIEGVVKIYGGNLIVGTTKISIAEAILTLASDEEYIHVKYERGTSSAEITTSSTEPESNNTYFRHMIAKFEKVTDPSTNVDKFYLTKRYWKGDIHLAAAIAYGW